MPHPIDPAFTSLPYRRLAEAALARARDFNVTHADFRFERVRYQDIRVRDGLLQGASDTEDLGFAVRVILDGAWGFASGVVLTPESAVQVAEKAVRTAQVAAAMTTRPIALAPEPVYDDVEWVSSYEIDPLGVPLAEKAELLAGWTRGLLDAPVVAHSSGLLRQVVENKFYADLAGTMTTQQRVRVEPEFQVYGSDEKSGRFDSMRTIAPPVGRGWEYLAGDGYDWASELAELPEERLTARFDTDSVLELTPERMRSFHGVPWWAFYVAGAALVLALPLLVTCGLSALSVHRFRFHLSLDGGWRHSRRHTPRASCPGALARLCRTCGAPGKSDSHARSRR